MGKTTKSTKRKASAKTAKQKKPVVKRRIRPVRRLVRWGFYAILAVFAWILLYSVVNPPTTPYMVSESRRLGGVDHQWVPIEEVSKHLPRSLVAAEDANFCRHWGLDLVAIEAAIDQGSTRGASTISQQVVKNAFLWQGRSWVRKVIEALLTPVTEALWSKRRILEIYMNVAEFDEGVFGIEAAARHYFGVGPEDLTALQSARLAAVLPNPKNRSASQPSNFLRKRSKSIMDGAATIRKDGRSSCFED